MKLPSCFSGTKCLLYGLGKSNSAVYPLLKSEGAEILLKDGKTTDEELERKALGLGLNSFEVYKKGEKLDFIFRSPGIRPDDRFITELVGNSGSALTSETELFFDRVKCRTVGITGSDGKTTTTTLTGKMLEKMPENKNSRIFVGGNIGTPLVSFLPEIKETDTVVCELSSFQLMTMNKSPDAACITNITENHLDYHKNMDEYVSAKLNICSFSERLVIKRETFGELNGKYRLPKKTILYSAYSGRDGLYSDGKNVYRDKEKLFSLEETLVKGKHNAENFMAAAALSGADPETVGLVARTFAGVPHRMEFVCEKQGVRFYNSSIDSTPSRSTVTLGCFEKPPVLICGGYDKRLDYSEFFRFAAAKCKSIVTTGNTGRFFYERLKLLKDGVYFEEEFEKAVDTAFSLAEKGESVILSPACASFDRFRNFEERGDLFKKIVLNYQ